jgi:endonuclease YncB( thermonuclease family)
VGSRGLRRLGLLLALACAGCGGGDPAPTAGEAVVGSIAVVDSVRDGDTILLEDGRRVRLVQVDAPELGVECHGDAAARELERLLPAGTSVRLERDPRLDDRDRHDRLLRYVEAGGRNVGIELVRAGAAAPYFYRGVRGRHADALLAAAAEARDARRGLWAACPRTRLEPRRAIETGRP